MPALLKSDSSSSASTLLKLTSMEVNVQLALDTNTSLEYISLSKHIFGQYYGNSSNVQNKYISVQLKGSSIFAESKIYPFTVNYELPNNTIELNSLSILQLYGANFTIDTGIITPITKLPLLKSMVIGFPTEVYQLLESYPKEQLLALLAKERESNLNFIIFRKGDYSNSLNGRIIHCEPFDQGYADMETEIVVSKLDENPNSLDFPLKNYDNNLELEFDPFGLNSDINSNDSKKFCLKTRCLKFDTLRSFTQQSSSSPEFRFDDDQLFACVESSVLQKIGCLSGDLVKCRTSLSDFYIRLFPFIDPNQFDQDAIYMSPLFLSSIKNPETVTISRLEANQKPELPSFKLEKFVPTAKEVVIARVASPITLDRTLQQLFLSNLKSHFEHKHRVIMLNQFIPITIDTYLARSLHDTYESFGNHGNEFPSVIPQGQPDEIAWFKITGGLIDSENGNEIGLVPGQQYIIDSSKTRMIQAGAVTENLPFKKDNIFLSNVESYLGLPDLFPFNNVTTASGEMTFQYAKQLRTIICTALKVKGKVNLPTTVLLTSLSRSIGKTTLVRSLAKEICVNLIELDGYELLNQSSTSKTIGTLRGKVDSAVQQCSNLILYIKHIESLVKKIDPQQQQKEMLSLKLAELIDEYTNQGVIIITSSNDPDSLSETIRSKLKFEISISVPSELERKSIFRYLVDFSNKGSRKSIKDDYTFSAREDVSIDTLALQSAGLTPNDLVSIVNNGKNVAIDRLEDKADEYELTLDELVSLSGGMIKFIPEDFEQSINTARSKFSDSIGAPKIPNVKWEDVGGLDMVKDEILDTIDMPLKHPELFSTGMKKRSGILFYGPPGTGKTLLAKAIATNFALNFFSVKGPELLNMYIGESEANVRRVFQKARDAKPCVIFFDELDSVAPKRGNQGDSGGVMDRIVSQLLAELDGMSGGENGSDGVFVVGATNRPDLLDEALLRPGRFDKMLYLGISDTHQKQAKIIQALTRKFKISPEVNIPKISESCPFTFTGADFYALSSDAMLNAMTRTAGLVDEKIKKYNEGKPEDEIINSRYWFDNIATAEDIEVLVATEDFEKARRDLIPSVSADELDHYLNIRKNFEGGKVKQNN